MKQLFDEEDQASGIDTAIRSGMKGTIPRPESSEWDLHKHKIEYE